MNPKVYVLCFFILYHTLVIFGYGKELFGLLDKRHKLQKLSGSYFNWKGAQDVKISNLESDRFQSVNYNQLVSTCRRQVMFKRTCAPCPYHCRTCTPDNSVYNQTMKLCPGADVFAKSYFNKNNRLMVSGIAATTPSLSLRLEIIDYIYYAFRPAVSKMVSMIKKNDTDFSSISNPLNYTAEDILKQQPRLANLSPAFLDLQILPIELSTSNNDSTTIRKGTIPKIKWNVLSSNSPFYLLITTSKSGFAFELNTYNMKTSTWTRYKTNFLTVKNWLQYQVLKGLMVVESQNILELKTYANELVPLKSNQTVTQT